LGIPIRTWYNYESGVTVPGEVILRFVELTGVDPNWLLHGEGPRYRTSHPPVKSSGSRDSVEDLLSRALQRLCRKGRHDDQAPSPPPGPDADGSPATFPPETGEVVLVGVEAEGGPPAAEPRYMVAQRGWLSDASNCRCVRNSGEAMLPIIADGAFVTFARPRTTPRPWAASWSSPGWTAAPGPLVRALGPVALLRAENPAFEPNILPIDLKHPPKGLRFHRVLGISTPH
jgi:hypothetical protein